MRRVLQAAVLSLVLASCGGAQRAADTTQPAAPTTLPSASTSTTVAAAATVPVTGPVTTTTSAPATARACATKADRGPLTVLAASSMQNVLTAARQRFLRDHPCVTALDVSYGSSATLAAQVVSGSPADVFVSASDATMATVVNAGLARSGPVVFARNNGALMVSPRSQYRGTISGIPDLLDSANSGIKVGLCVVSAPCGSLADRIMKAAGSSLGRTDLTRARIADTETGSVEDLVSKIEMGELDAGIVYASDCVYAIRLGLAACVPFPADINQSNNYLAAGLNSRRNSADFVKVMTSSWFAALLTNEYGFLAP